MDLILLMCSSFIHVNIWSAQIDEVSNYHYFSLSFAYDAPRTWNVYLFISGFQHCTGHITVGSWKGRGKQYTEFARVLYCKLLTNGKQLPAFPLEAVPGTKLSTEVVNRIVSLSFCKSLPNLVFLVLFRSFLWCRPLQCF